MKNFKINKKNEIKIIKIKRKETFVGILEDCFVQMNLIRL